LSKEVVSKGQMWWMFKIRHIYKQLKINSLKDMLGI